MIHLLLALMFLGVLAAPSSARACSIVGPTPYPFDPTLKASDQVPPNLAPVSIIRLNRGTGGKACSSFSCDGIGSLGLAVSATDDMAAPTDIGFRFSIVSGAAPKNLFPLAGEAIRSQGGELWLNWNDGPPDDHVTIDFTFQVVALDRAGNESAPQILRVRNDVGGCGIVAAGSPERTALVFSALVLVAALRSRRHHR